MKLPSIVTDKKARDDIKEKFEVVMAVCVLVGFGYKKIQEKKENQNGEDFQN